MEGDDDEGEDEERVKGRLRRRMIRIKGRVGREIEIEMGGDLYIFKALLVDGCDVDGSVVLMWV